MRKLLFLLLLSFSTLSFASELGFSKPTTEKESLIIKDNSLDCEVKFIDVKANCFPVTFTGDNGSITFTWCDSLEKLDELIEEFLK